MGNTSLNQQFRMTDDDFERIKGWIRELTGIKISDAKRQMVYSRLTKRLRLLGYTEFKDYLDYVEEGADDELVNFKNAITTNLTSFFREPHHFEYLKSTVLPFIKKEAELGRKTVRIWSAGCSTGEEAYSLAYTLNRFFPQKAGWDIKILATDIDTNVLRHGGEGKYLLEKLKDLDVELVKRIFSPIRDDPTQVQVKDHLRKMVVFNHLNLMSPDWPMRKKFDFIFCRNVMIYFDKAVQNQLVTRFWDILKDDAYLFIGHSESLFGVTSKYKLMGKNIYKRVHEEEGVG